MNQAVVTPDIDTSSIELTEKEFDMLRQIVYERSRIKLADNKIQMLRRRVQRRMGTLGLDNVNAYCALLKQDNSKELTHFINEVTTNLTYFFREIHHFEYLKETVLPAILASKQKRLRVWSAGCSTGEEPYTLAIVLKEMARDFTGWNSRILASDLSFDVLETCRNGVYDVRQIDEHTSPERMKKWFRGSKDPKDTRMTVDPSLRQMITFNQLNLFDRWPMKQKIDVIFCRNVMIYFDKPTKQKLVQGFVDVLAPGGHLFIGHSETLMNISDRFELVHKTTYRLKD